MGHLGEGPAWSRPSRASRVRDAVVEALGEVVGEAALTVAAFALLAGAIVLVRWGWSHSPVVTTALTGAFVVSLGYGTLSVLHPAHGRQRRGRLTTAAVITFGIALVCIAYAPL